MAKDFPDPEQAYHDGSAMAYPERFIKIVPTVPAIGSDRPQLRPVLPIGKD